MFALCGTQVFSLELKFIMSNKLCLAAMNTFNNMNNQGTLIATNNKIIHNKTQHLTQSIKM